MRLTFEQYLAHESRVTHGIPAAQSKSEQRESVLHGQIISESRRRNWIVVHSRTDKRTTTALGVPDFILVAPARVYFIECKTAKGKLSREQLGMKAWLSMLGHELHVVRSMSDFFNVVGPF